MEVHYHKDAAGKEILVMGRAGDDDCVTGKDVKTTAGAQRCEPNKPMARSTPYRGHNKIMMMEWEKEVRGSLLLQEDDKVNIQLLSHV